MALGQTSFHFDPFKGRDMSVPTPGGGQTTATNPYGGFDPNTINIEPYQQIQSFIQEQATDPNEALKEQMQENITEQVMAAQQAYGLGAGEGTAGSGVGLQAVGETIAKFEPDWQDRQLGRAVQGAGAMFGAGQLMQDVANRGMIHSQMLGESAFENPIAGGGGGARTTYGGHTNLSAGRMGPGVPSFRDRPSIRERQAPARAAAAARADAMQQMQMQDRFRRDALAQQQRQFDAEMALRQRGMDDRSYYMDRAMERQARGMNYITPGAGGFGGSDFSRYQASAPTYNFLQGRGPTTFREAQRTAPTYNFLQGGGGSDFSSIAGRMPTYNFLGSTGYQTDFRKYV